MSILSRTVAWCCAAIFAGALVGSSAVAETLLERGAYLVNGIGNCGNCHSPQQPDGTLSGPALSGGKALLAPGVIAYPPNLTPDPETGLGGWTEEQIVTALREGHTPAGDVLRPPMPIAFYRGVSDRDARAIAVYLRSLASVKSETLPSEYSIPTPDGYGESVGVIPDPDMSDKVAYGHYLVQLGHCMLCHTPRDASGRPDLVHRTGAGGAVMRGVFGEIVSPNITPDVRFGIGGWTNQQIKDALIKGRRPDGSVLASPMPWRYLATMRDEDIDAIVAYLRTITPIGN
jgi:mono/diheme cytochrome c family protein